MTSFNREFRRTLAILSVLLLAGRDVVASTVSVTNAGDSGSGSLRSALSAAANDSTVSAVEWKSGGAGTLTLASDLPGIVDGLTLDVSAAGNAVTIAGGPNALSLLGAATFRNNDVGLDWTISAPVNGGGSLAKTGVGLLALTGVNNYSGGTYLKGGTLAVNSDAALGSGALYFAGGSLRAVGAVVSSRVLSLGVLGGGVDANGFNSSFSGPIAGEGLLTLSDSSGGGSITLSGANTATGGLKIDGTSSLTVLAGGVNVLGSGAVTLQSGAGHADLNLAGFTQTIGALAGDANSTVELGAGVLTVSGGADGHFAGVISDGGAGGGLVKTGAGTLTLSGANTYSGGTSVVRGAISIDNQAELGLGPLILDGGGLKTNAGLVFSSDVAMGGAGGFIDTAGNISTFTGVVSGLSGLTKMGLGTLTLTGANLYTGGTTMAGGVLRVSSESALGSGGLNFTGGTLQTAASLMDSRAVSLAGNGTIDAAGSTSTFSGVFADGASAGALTIVDTLGAGTIVLTATNTYTGGTAINSGVLSVSTDANLGAASGALSFNGGRLQTTAAIATLRAVTLNAGGGTLDLLTSSSTFSGLIGGGGALTVQGSGTLTLTAENTYSGGTNLKGATVNINNSSGLGSGTISFVSPAALQLNGALTLANAIALASTATFATLGNNSTLSGAITGAGSLIKISTGTLFLTNSNSYSGGTAVYAGVLNARKASSLGAGAVTLDGGTLQLDSAMALSNSFILGAGSGTIDTQNSDSVLLGAIAGSGGLTKLGAGVLQLNAVNSYAGTTTVGEGTLRLGVDNALASAGALTTRAGGTFDLGTHVQTLASYAGPGVLGVTLSPLVTNLTLTGTADFTGGTLKVALTPQIVNDGDAFTPIAYGSKTGQFAEILSPAALSFTSATYNAGSLTLTAHLVPFAQSAATGNQSAIGRSLEGLRNHPTGDVAAVIGNLYTLAAPELQAALDQIGPISLASMRGIGAAAATAQNAAIGQRLAAIADGGSAKDSYAHYTVSKPSPYPGLLVASAANDMGAPSAADLAEADAAGSPWGFFTSGIVTTGKLAEASSGGGTQPGYAYNTGGVSAGADYRLDEHTAVGASAGYLRGHASIYSPASGTVDDNSARFGVYGTKFAENVRASLYLGGAADFYDTHRVVAFAGLDRTASAKPTGTELNSSASASYDVKTSRWGTYSPFATLNYNRLMIGRFSETGADALDLDVAPQTSSSLQSGLGLRFSDLFEGASVSWRPYASLGWRHEFLSQSRTIDAQLATAGSSPFSVATGEYARDGALVGAGFLVSMGKSSTFKLDYSGDYRSHFQENTVNGVFRFKF
jgi:autotransporter-associated beta strand protein